MFSLNVPVPGTIARLASDLHPRLVDFDTIRERHTLVVKRFETDQRATTDSATQLARLQEQLRPVLRGTPAFDANVPRIGMFREPPTGRQPVVYLAVESPGIQRIHREMVGEFGAVSGLEGERYVPHITLARGGSQSAAQTLCESPIDPVSWTVSELVIWDGHSREPAARYSLPA